MQVPATGRATTVKKTFSRSTTVSTDIAADPSLVWTLLTSAADYSRWNSTIVSLSGRIAVGEKIRLVSTLDPSREFRLTVKEMTPAARMVWGDVMGQRTYLLEPLATGRTRFTMTERIGGPLFPLFASKIPSFDAHFTQFAADLKQEAETINQHR